MRRKGTGPWSAIARELKRRFLRRLLFRFRDDKAAVANHIGISMEHLDTLVRDHGLLGYEPRKRKVVAKPEPQPRARREWFGVQVSP